MKIPGAVCFHLVALLLILVRCIKKKKGGIEKKSNVMYGFLIRNTGVGEQWKGGTMRMNRALFLSERLPLLSNIGKATSTKNRDVTMYRLIFPNSRGRINLFCTRSQEGSRRTKIKELLKSEMKDVEKKNFKICGWIKSMRTVGKNCFAFIDINDGSYYKSLQVVIDAKIANYNMVVKSSTDDAIECVGELKRSAGKKQNVELSIYDPSKKHYVKLFNRVVDEHIDGGLNKLNNVSNEEIHTEMERDVYKKGLLPEGIGSEKVLQEKGEHYMISKKFHTKHYLRNFPHLRARTKLYSSIFRLKSDVITETFTFFRKRKCAYINTPILTSNDCEGAGSLFHATRLFSGMGSSESINVKNKEENTPVMNSFVKDFFGKACYLNVSSQLALECLCCSMGDVFTLNQSFRAENSNTFRHLSEFLMLEVELAFSNLDDIISLSEEYIKEIISFALYKSEDIEYLNESCDKNIKKKLENVLKKKFAIITYDDVMKLLQRENPLLDMGSRGNADISFEEQKFLTNVYFQSPIVIVDFPKDIKPFYMKLNKDKRTVSCMDIIFPDVGEVVGGSERETHLSTLIKQMQNKNLDVTLYEPYLHLRKYGNIPHAGFGLGIDRLIMFIASLNNIRDVVPFPRSPRSLFM
ncbi:asparagine--tRNA ligase [Plasmodium ovale]|uniref:asparagine--tRNA ligase n=1 Tax=Plasmodium ovale TaxID=36330 RepID=A0A1D3U8V0_PLAOA|nr:asparagine--tRNA ligase [Plasmodium ovale]